MLEYFGGRKEIRCLAFSKSWSNKSTQGRVTPANLAYGVYYIARSAFYMIRDRPRGLFFSIPKGIAAFLRMIPLLYLAQILGIKVHGELAGANFLFIEKGGWQRRMGLHYLRKIHSLRFLGNSIASHHERYRFSGVTVFPNGIEHPRVKAEAELQVGTGRLELLFVGELSESKGVYRVLDALRMARQEHLDVFCTLVGEWKDPVYERRMLDYIRANDLGQLIHLTGLLKGQGKWDYFNKAQVLVHPSDLDGQPLSILEAMGSGLAVISTRVGAIPDTIEDGVNGIILSEISGHALYAAIRRLYYDRSLMHSMQVKNIETFNARYTVSRYLENVEKWLQADLPM